MKFRNVFSALLAVLLIAALFAGCVSTPATTEAPKTEAPATTEAPKTEAPATEAPATEAPADTQALDKSEFYVEINGQKIVVGVPFEELVPLLPEETAPAETIGSCDENSDWRQTTHTYDGFIIAEDKDGIAVGIVVSSGDCALNGQLRIGSTRDEVKALLGEPDTDAEWGLYYDDPLPMVDFMLDEESNTVTSFSLMIAFVM